MGEVAYTIVRRDADTISDSSAVDTDEDCVCRGRGCCRSKHKRGGELHFAGRVFLV